MTSTALQSHPIDMSVSAHLRRSRLTAFLRLLLLTQRYPSLSGGPTL
jgi:hypothetical protein